MDRHQICSLKCNLAKRPKMMSHIVNQTKSHLNLQGNKVTICRTCTTCFKINLLKRNKMYSLYLNWLNNKEIVTIQLLKRLQITHSNTLIKSKY